MVLILQLVKHRHNSARMRGPIHLHRLCGKVLLRVDGGQGSHNVVLCAVGTTFLLLVSPLRLGQLGIYWVKGVHCPYRGSGEREAALGELPSQRQKSLGH